MAYGWWPNSSARYVLVVSWKPELEQSSQFIAVPLPKQLIAKCLHAKEANSTNQR